MTIAPILLFEQLRNRIQGYTLVGLFFVKSNQFLLLIFALISAFLFIDHTSVNCAESKENNTKTLIYTDVIKIPVDKFVLVRKGSSYGAFKILGKLKDKYGWDYEWVMNTNKSGQFKGKETRRGTGQIFEFYERTPKEGGGYHLIDKGGELYFYIGSDIKLNWSYPLWLYLPEGKNKDEIMVAITDVSNIDFLKTSDPKYQWYVYKTKDSGLDSVLPKNK